MDIIAKLEQMAVDGKKVVSIDFMIKELRGIPPTRKQTVRIVPRIDFVHSTRETEAEAYWKPYTGL